MAESEVKPGAVCYLEIPAPDLESAKAFYAQVFGWKISPVPEGGYALWDDGNCGGGFDPKAQVSDRKGINLVLKVLDIPAKLEEIKRAGGAVVREKFDLGGGFGFLAYFKDPNGNLLSIWSKA